MTVQNVSVIHRSSLPAAREKSNAWPEILPGDQHARTEVDRCTHKVAL